MAKPEATKPTFDSEEAAIIFDGIIAQQLTASPALLDYFHGYVSDPEKQHLDDTMVKLWVRAAKEPKNRAEIVVRIRENGGQLVEEEEMPALIREVKADLGKNITMEDVFSEIGDTLRDSESGGVIQVADELVCAINAGLEPFSESAPLRDSLNKVNAAAQQLHEKGGEYYSEKESLEDDKHLGLLRMQHKGKLVMPLMQLDKALSELERRLDSEALPSAPACAGELRDYALILAEGLREITKGIRSEVGIPQVAAGQSGGGKK